MLSWDEREALTDAEPWVPDDGPSWHDAVECFECEDGGALPEGETCPHCGTEGREGRY